MPVVAGSYRARQWAYALVLGGAGANGRKEHPPTNLKTSAYARFEGGGSVDSLSR